MSQVVVEGRSIEVVERGSGSPVVYVHSALADRTSAEANAPAFARSHRFVSYARSHAPVREQARELAALLRALGAAPAHLVGVSLGGHVALLVARDHPELVRSLVLVDPVMLSLYGKPMGPELAQAIAAESPEAAASFGTLAAECFGPAIGRWTAGDRAGAARHFTQFILNGVRIPEERMARAVAEAGSIEELLFGAPEPLSAEEAARIRAPTLVLSGDRDLPVFQHVCRKLAATMPDARYEELPGAHWVDEQDPAAFQRLALAHVRGSESLTSASAAAARGST